MKGQKVRTVEILALPKEAGLEKLKVVHFEASKLSSHITFEVGKLLSPAELRKAAKFRQQKDRLVYISGRGILRRLSGDMLKKPGSSLVLKEGQYGKPYFEGYEQTLPFNLSNSGDHIALAFNFDKRPVGIDIEVIDPKFQYMDIAGAYFSAKECQTILSHRDFFRLWTMKEALLKVTGVGLVSDLNFMDLSERNSRVKIYDERLLPFRNKIYSLYTFENEQIAYTVAVQGNFKLSRKNKLGTQLRMATRHVTFV